MIKIKIAKNVPSRNDNNKEKSKQTESRMSMTELDSSFLMMKMNLKKKIIILCPNN